MSDRRIVKTLISIIAIFLICLNASHASDIHIAVQQGDLSAVKRALADDASVLNEIGGGGQTPLMSATLRGHYDICEYLLHAGADVSIPEKDGYTPLHGAGFQGRSKIAALLLDFGLDPYKAHEDGYYPMHRACWGREKRHTETVRVFLRHGVPAHQKGKDGRRCMDMTRNEHTRQLLSKEISQRGGL